VALAHTSALGSDVNAVRGTSGSPTGTGYDSMLGLLQQQVVRVSVVNAMSAAQAQCVTTYMEPRKGLIEFHPPNELHNSLREKGIVNGLKMAIARP
jgi:hypothetical protein